ncbi:MAG: glycine--tRNA ligase subunit beta [Alphaproteobacteria bacterium]|nr:glycine--tRNA ligase subunit beta [Alphaproteobacteria bacterium]MBU0795849.1 glycine--tRNA ligase subunit beta [Alphaproteobacteria bacterium]MBU0885743.1 glycine--tRNA ligase subunit beta [Alphaproteobacteria bacterium]MBU1814446.1 glycine--tRNA ligase subunit beta [Alphaproteobacteria bacterium]
MAELLLEIFSEEIPARMQARAADDLKRLATDAMTAAGLTFDSAAAYVTPRRLALVVDGLPLTQPDVTEERRGPRVGAPEQALAGFLKANNLTSIEACEQRDTGKGVFYFLTVEKPGAATQDVLPGLLLEVIQKLPWPKSMNWGDGSFRWVRPIHSIICLFNAQELPGRLDLGGGREIVFADRTKGHRFMARGELVIDNFDDYKAKLKAAKVILDPAERRATILSQAEALAAKAGLTLKQDDGLLDEVTGLVEWPLALMGRIDDAFMDVPPEVLTTSMRAHQKYFALETADGALAPHFIVISNMQPADGGTVIVAGNERVLRARLSDAKFFWDQDRRHTLASRLPALANITFHAKLGTLEDKVSRVRKLAAHLATLIPGADTKVADRAAQLAKADLVTGMVGEFPELQGIMGRYYARHDGESEAVAQAIADHYSPQGPSDRCPTAPNSVALALADKLDTLVGFFAIDEKPTGSKDPYALRRAALGIIRLIVENGLRLPLAAVFAQAGAKPDTVDELIAFFADRLKVAMREQGVRHDLVTAVFALGKEDDLVRLLKRVEALAGFLSSEDGANLLIAYRRAANIVAIEEKKDGRLYVGPASAGTEPAEAELHRGLAVIEGRIAEALKTEDFAAAMGALADLRGPVDSFFDKVTVNAEDAALRENRLKLLATIRDTMNRIADFSKVEG